MEQLVEESTTTALEWNGDAYHRLSDMQYELAMQFLDTLTLHPSSTVMDAGCGSGRITREILARLPAGGVIGVDVSHSMLEIARQVVQAQPGQRVTLLQADLQTFVQPAAADGIFSNMALHFVQDHAALLAHFACTLRPGGWLALQFGRATQQQDLARQLRHMLCQPPFGTYLQGAAFNFRGGEPATTEQYLRAAGFTAIHIEVLPVTMVQAHRDKMTEFFNTTIRRDCLDRLPTTALRTQFDATMEDFLTDAFAQPFEYLRVTARLAAVH